MQCRVSVQGVKSLGGHFACLCRGFEFYEVKKNCTNYIRQFYVVTYPAMIMMIFNLNENENSD